MHGRRMLKKLPVISTSPEPRAPAQRHGTTATISEESGHNGTTAILPVRFDAHAMEWRLLSQCISIGLCPPFHVWQQLHLVGFPDPISPALLRMRFSALALAVLSACVVSIQAYDYSTAKLCTTKYGPKSTSAKTTSYALTVFVTITNKFTTTPTSTVTPPPQTTTTTTTSTV